MVDTAKILIRSGKGGDGAVSFRRERFIPEGGPDGGDGGKGGDVYLVTDPNMNTLDDFAHQQKFFAENGQGGRGRQMYGKNGDDLTIKVPIGTVIKMTPVIKYSAEGTYGDEKVGRKAHRDAGKVVAVDKVIDMDKPGMKILIAEGGRGGRGNVRFKGPSNTTPMVSEQGQENMSYEAELELKLLADVGLVGLPNAGKSTLLSVLSNARPKVADYEFTTLEPNLGVLKTGNIHLVIADLPGLIEGASEGKGLGIKFLKHIERTKVLIHLVSVTNGTAEEIFKKYKLIEKELLGYGTDITTKENIVVLSKIDLVDQEKVDEVVIYFKKKKIDILPISSATQKGIPLLISRMGRIN